MADDIDNLARLRTEIDRIDDTVIDLLVERMGYVGAIAAAKGVGDGRLAIRPSREAAILRRLDGRADGKLPTDSVVRIWREIISAATSKQTPYAVAVQAPEAEPIAMERARSHFGMTTPLVRTETSDQALQLLLAGEVAVAALGLFDPEDRWWARLQPAELEGRQVFGRVPFVAKEGMGEAWLLGPVAPEPSGQDLSLVRIGTGPDFAPARLVEQLAKAGLPVRHLAVGPEGEGDGVVHLVEADGFFVANEDELAEATIVLRHELLHCTVLGAYPQGLAAGAAG
ncbi:chorismate mutase [Geminicoccus roseus]|uniref:chorismate mutase n=1 Tax=Geminicoccus roseus TaxID=404900 RepID=UPI0003FC9C95|nr:chorismate mutase [Geminicoccus roseus]